MFRKHKQNTIISYTDFMMNLDRFLYSIDYSWEENGVGILSKWLPDTIEELDELLKYC